MTQLTVDTALKQLQAKKIRENMLIITVGYNNKIVLPHKDGMAFLASIANAEEFENDYGKNPIIKGLSRSAVTVSTMSADEYEDIKLSALLGITLDELKQSRLPQPST